MALRGTCIILCLGIYVSKSKQEELDVCWQGWQGTYIGTIQLRGERRGRHLDRLKLFADYLNPNSKDVHQEPVKRDNVKNGSKLRWQSNRICSWRFYSKDNFYTFDVEKHDCLDDSTLSDIESSITVNFKSGNLFYRLYRAMKHVFGYRSRYGDFDSFEFNEEDADWLHDFIKSSAAAV